MNIQILISGHPAMVGHHAGANIGTITANVAHPSESGERIASIVTIEARDRAQGAFIRSHHRSSAACQGHGSTAEPAKT